MENAHAEVVRKGWHMASGLAAAPLILYTNLPYATVVALAAAFFLLSMELLRLQFAIELPFWSQQLERVRRPEERFNWASIGFLLTLVLLFWLMPIPIALAAAGMLAFGDGMSALVGRRWGTTRIQWNFHKSWEGSLSGFFAGLLGALVLVYWYAEVANQGLHLPHVVLALAVGSAAAMGAESIEGLEDNVTVPLAAGLGVWPAWWLLGLEPSLGPVAALWTG